MNHYLNDIYNYHYLNYLILRNHMLTHTSHLTLIFLSWTAVKTAFALRFESHDHINQVKKQYKSLKYTHDDTVQSFNHRFTNICDELSYDVNSPIIIDNFMSLLPSDMHRRFLMQCHGRQVTLSSFTTLDAIVADITSMENAYNNSQYIASTHDNNNNDHHRHHNSSNNRASSKTVSFHGSKTIYPSSSSAFTPVKICKNHPGSTGHTTAECRLNGLQKSFTSSSSGSVPPTSKSVHTSTCVL